MRGLDGEVTRPPLALLLASTAATLLVLEAAARLTSAVPEAPARPVRPTHPTPAPGPAVLLLGDSFAFGSGIARAEDTLSGQLSRASGLPVVNAGLPGSLTDDWLRVACARRDERPWLAVVISWSPRDGVAFGPENGTMREALDLGGGRWCGPSVLCRALAWRWSRWQVGRAYRAWLTNGYQDEALEWRRARANLREIRAAFDAPMVLAVWPALVSLRGEYPLPEAHDAVRWWARGAGFEVVDLLPAFRGTDERRWWVAANDQHPNPAAVAVAVREIWPALAGVMREE